MPCTCNRNNWRQWIQPLLVVIYIIFILVSVSFGVWELQKLKAGMYIQPWLIAGVFMLLTIPVSLYGILQHLLHFTQPQLQKPIIRSSLNIFATTSWLSVKFPKIAIYMDTLKESYEAFVLYNLMILLRNYIQIQFPSVMVHLKTKQQHLPTLCCCPPWATGE
ncbi:Transmembrane protein 184C [Microtus ochrogaster]|uniref:Transmembrane protein 184C n=1 Tax=Microtus ochrogaster TaxID=79684 RepID=A0A8J6H049_MICOH|nr:Transmembrane protein 184C [Microtus ochrogaster]